MAKVKYTYNLTNTTNSSFTFRQKMIIFGTAIAYSQLMTSTFQITSMTLKKCYYQIYLAYVKELVVWTCL